MYPKILFVVLSFVLFAFAIGDDSLTFTQTKIKEWDNGNHVQWEVTIINNDSLKRTIFDAFINGNENFKPDGIWSLDLSEEKKYHFPSYLTQFGGLKFGLNHTFGYINTCNSQATFGASDIKY
ncbi:hypothetical protein ACTA71_006951 [Dictyostelium dimigraforme]